MNVSTYNENLIQDLYVELGNICGIPILLDKYNTLTKVLFGNMYEITPGYTILEGHYFILIPPKFAKLATARQVQAVCLHEYGHITDSEYKNGHISIDGLQDAEIRADHCAFLSGYGSDLIEALEIIRNNSNVRVDSKGYEDVEERIQILKNKQMSIVK